MKAKEIFSRGMDLSLASLFICAGGFLMSLAFGKKEEKVPAETK